jgi:hypothetical protein
MSGTLRNQHVKRKNALFPRAQPLRARSARIHNSLNMFLEDIKYEESFSGVKTTDS